MKKPCSSFNLLHSEAEIQDIYAQGKIDIVQIILALKCMKVFSNSHNVTVVDSSSSVIDD